MAPVPEFAIRLLYGDMAEIVTEGEHSIGVRIETWARTRGAGAAAEKVTEGVYTYVALDEDGAPKEIGPE